MSRDRSATFTPIFPGFPVKNTLSNSGTVSRCVCEKDENGYLTSIEEHTKLEEVNGVIISETVFKMDGNMLTNYMKHNYKYDTNQQRTEDESQKWNSNKNCWENNLCIRYIHGNKSITTEYYKWNSKKKEYILVPEMTVTMDK